MKAYIEQLMDYNYWANGLIMKYAEKLPVETFTAPVSDTLSSPRDILAHVLFAETIWLDRMQGIQRSLDEMLKAFRSENYPEIKDLFGDWFELELRMRQYLADLDEKTLLSTFTYSRTDGTAQEDRYIDIFTQLVFHGMQHRSEMAQILTDFGHSPGNIDYIIYLRP